MKKILFLVFILIIASCTPKNQSMQSTAPKIDPDDSIATFAGGCFWCMEGPFEELMGVNAVISGFAGGTEENPTYKEVSSGKTGHVEAVQVYYDPSIVSYSELLDIYWRQINPTDDAGQFADRGFQYTTAIFYRDDIEKELASQSKNLLQKSGIFDSLIVTPLKQFTTFYPAEEYHQDYHIKNNIQYKIYRKASGREDYLKNIWEKEYIVSDEDKSNLSKLQYWVTQQDGTEPPFYNEYWDNKEEGIYVDLISGEPLFSSTDKYKSGTGWPSFTKPLVTDNIVKKVDRSLVIPRIEIRSKNANSHLGHVFNDGPDPTGLRYCMNSAALKFVPKEALNDQGYGEFMHLFS